MKMLITLSIFCLYAYAVSGANTVQATITFYGARDNCPPGGDIAYPTLHKEAGGNGTYVNPITFAGTKKKTKVGQIIYVNFLQKYFMMEDDCEECDHENDYHFDLWMGPDQVTAGPNLIACEDGLTPDKSSSVIIDPAKDLTVNHTPLFNGTSLKCIMPNPPPCVTKNVNKCGNECELDKKGTCQQIANELLLNLTRFEQLNTKLDCPQNPNKVIPEGTTVCMGGPCGD